MGGCVRGRRLTSRNLNNLVGFQPTHFLKRCWRQIGSFLLGSLVKIKKHVETTYQIQHKVTFFGGHFQWPPIWGINQRSLENLGFRAPKSIPQLFEACNTCHFQTHLRPRRIEIKFGKLDGSRGDAISDLEVIYRILVTCLMPFSQFSWSSQPKYYKGIAQSKMNRLKFFSYRWTVLDTWDHIF